jgi:hypothetical protein
MGIVFRSVVGSCIHSHEFSRIYRLTGDLLRSNNSDILHLATLESPSTKRLGKATSLHRPFIGLESRKRSSSSMGIDSFQPKLVDVWKVKASPLLQRPLRLGRGRASVCHKAAGRDLVLGKYLAALTTSRLAMIASGRMIPPRSNTVLSELGPRDVNG